MAGTSYEFVIALNGWVKRTQESMELTVRVLTLGAYGRLLQRSPIDTRRFRDSWRYSINSPDTTSEPPRKRSHGDAGLGGSVPPSVGELYAPISTAIDFKLGDIIYITNNVPYAQALEDGRSPQGSAFTRLTYEELLSDLRSARDSDVR